jgi:predicted metal-dependent phosphoesterase TrpH
MFLGDFHVHSTFSDGKMTIPQLVDMYGSRGFGAIAITDHLCETETVVGKASYYLGCSLSPATFPLYREILKSEAERAWHQYRLIVLPGFELSKNSLLNHRSSHILGIGINQFLPADGEPVDLARGIRAQGGIAIAAHPVWTRVMEKQTYLLWTHRAELEKEFDAWEVASGRFIFDEVKQSKLPKIASSDLHIRRQLSSWKTVLHCERHPDAILDAIRKQELDYHYYHEVEAYAGAPTDLLTYPRVGDRVRSYAVGNLVLTAAVS